MRREILFFITVVSTILFSCESVDVYESDGVVEFSLKMGTDSKSVVREIPDTNQFILKVTDQSGAIIYNGLYKDKPAEFTLKSGAYEVEVKSISFTVPEFEKPLYADSKLFLIESGKVTRLSLVCSQVNSGLRFEFSNAFRARFNEYYLKVSDSLGSAIYPYSETRFLYINRGKVSLNLISSTSQFDSIFILSRIMAANTMLTLNLDVLSSGFSPMESGIIIDTSSIWEFDRFTYGKESEGDGLSATSPLLISQLSKYIGSSSVWIKGYICGGDLTQSTVKFVAPFSSETNLALSEFAGETSRQNCAGVALPSGAIRSALNLVSNPSNLGKILYLKGTIVASYFNIIGINNITEYKLE